MEGTDSALWISLSLRCLYNPPPYPFLSGVSLPGLDISHEERGRGPFQRKSALPLTSSFVAHRPVFSHGLGLPAPPASRKQMRKALGAGGAGLFGRSCWTAVPACFFLLLMPTGASRSGVTEARLSGCLAEGPGPGAVGLLASKTPAHALGCWSGQWTCLSPVTSFSSSQRWAFWLESSRRQRWQGVGSGGTEFLVWNQGSGFKSWLFQLCGHGQVTFLSHSLFMCKPHSFINLTNIIEHLLCARDF